MFCGRQYLNYILVFLVIFSNRILAIDLVITEIMPNPDAVSDSEGEYIEIYNNTDQSIDLSGYQIVDAGDNSVTINDLTISADDFVILAQTSDFLGDGSMTADYDNIPGLNNSDESIYLKNSSDETICEVNYSSSSAGIALELGKLTDSDDGTISESELKNAVRVMDNGDKGSPGEAGGTLGINPFVHPQVFINEINPKHGETDPEFIELIGPAGTDISGYTITHYNGAETVDGGLWSHTIGNFSIPDDGNTDNAGNKIGFFVIGNSESATNYDEYLTETMQNGADGIILYNKFGQILDAVAWEGAGDLADDDPGTVSTSGAPSDRNYLHVTADDNSTVNSLQAPNNVYGDDGSGWTLESSTPGYMNSGQTDTDVSLPIELSSFKAKYIDGKVILTWTTASEIDNAGFNIYKSMRNQQNFQKINSKLIPGSGTTSNQHTYTFKDNQVIEGLQYYYKIQDVSYSGETEFSEAISVNPKSENSSQIAGEFGIKKCYPNPFNASITIQYYVENSNATISIFNVKGQLIKTLGRSEVASGRGTFIWKGYDTNNNPVGSGIYFVKMINFKGQQDVQKLILVR